MQNYDRGQQGSRRSYDEDYYEDNDRNYGSRSYQNVGGSYDPEQQNTGSRNRDYYRERGSQNFGSEGDRYCLLYTSPEPTRP